jgi:hypothetical protein
LKTLIFALVVSALAGCPIPEPRPTVLDAGPGDLFTGKVFNCHLEIVAVERSSAAMDVRRCLLGQGTTNPPACLVTQATLYKPDTVACVARDLGADASSALNAGTATLDDKTLSATVREWIRSEGMGYR